MRQFKKITIVGVGLIGGSVGLAAKAKGVSDEVIGVFRHKSTLKKALKYKAVDRGTLDLRAGVKDAAIIVLAAPVHTIPKLAREVAGYAKRGAVITDVGSTKVWIVKVIEDILKSRPSIFFVGAHPMAGSEQQGVEHARHDLLEGAPCIITKTGRTDERALKSVTLFWKSLGSNVTIMNPLEHDRAVSLISHLPHIVAFSLAGAVPEKMLKFAAEGFRDTTRAAASDPGLWADIFLTNKGEIAKAGKLFEKYYKKVIRAILKGSYPETIRALAAAKGKRDKARLWQTG